MVSSKAGLLVQRPTRGPPFEQIKLRTNLSDYSLTQCALNSRKYLQRILSKSLLTMGVDPTELWKKLADSMKKVFSGWPLILHISISNNHHQSESAASLISTMFYHIAVSAKIAPELTNVLVIPQLQNEAKSRFVKRRRRNSS